MEWEDEVTLKDLPEILDTERFYLERIVASLSRKPTDPKLGAVLYFLQERRWLDLGCIVFSQY